MKLDRVETGGEDRPNEVVVFLENRASRGGFEGGALPFSFVYILLSSHLFSPRGFRRTLSRSPRPPIHLQPATSSTLSTLSTALRSLVAARCRRLSARWIRSKLFDVLFTWIPPRALVVWDASRGFICGRRRSQREGPTTIIYLQPLVVKRMVRATWLTHPGRFVRSE